MEIISLITLLVFVVCFVLYFIIAILMNISRKKVKRNLKRDFPTIWYSKFSFNNFLDYSLIPKGMKLIFSFGSKISVKQFNSHFLDIESVEKLGNSDMNDLLKQLSILTSIFAKLWIIILGTLIMIGILTVLN